VYVTRLTTFNVIPRDRFGNQKVLERIGIYFQIVSDPDNVIQPLISSQIVNITNGVSRVT
jgi:hypothetical protein